MVVLVIALPLSIAGKAPVPLRSSVLGSNGGYSCNRVGIGPVRDLKSRLECMNVCMYAGMHACMHVWYVWYV